jgi:hypothetical protein
MVTRVWIAQCLCPQRHCIVAVADTAFDRADAEQNIIGRLRATVEQWLADRTLNPWCGLCGLPRASWRYEVGRTRWATLREAMPEIRKNEAEQAVTAAVWGDSPHRQRPN